MADLASNDIVGLVVSDPSLVEDAFDDLGASSRLKRKNAAHFLNQIAQVEPGVLAPRISDFVAALDNREAQTRWECLDALSALVPFDSRACDKAVNGAEVALFDEDSGPLHLSAFRFLSVFGATTPMRSQRVWPLLDEAIQCYHGDLEYSDMLSCMVNFTTGKISSAIKQEIYDRFEFDAKHAGVFSKKSQAILDNVTA